jgi:hypothetical protein
VALQGTIDSFALADVMRLLGSSSKTGRLIVNGDRGSANLWFDAGQLVGGGSSTQTGEFELSEVVFDILRYATGSFIFEADSACPTPIEGESIDDVIEQAEVALAEWGEIVRVVPSMDSWLRLAPELQYPEVVVDQACWTAIVAVGGGRTVRELGDLLGLGELPSSRLVRALVGAGFVEVTAAPEPEAAPPAPAADLVQLPSRHATPETAERFEVEDPFGGFEPFDAQAEEDAVALPSLTISGLTDDPFAGPFPGDAERGEGPPWIEPPVETPEPDVKRSMSMLSEKAAQALASVAGGDGTTGDPSAEEAEESDDERAKMLRFLGSV